MSRKLLIVSLLVLGTAPSARAIDPRLPVIEPSELIRRPDLIDRPLAVEDRVTRFQWHRDRDIDEIYLSRTPVIFRLPPRLRYERSPQAAAVRIEGVLKREGDFWYCDVTAVDLLPADLKRLEAGVAALAADDDKGRLAWARWAETRGKEFKDQALRDRARSLESEAIWIEADRRGTDRPRRWLELARRARERQIPEPDPSALAHRAFVARLEAAEGVADLQALVGEIVGFWPGSPTPIRDDGGGEADLTPWLASYSKDPTVYRTVPEPVRRALDHWIWAEATQRLYERRIEAEPGESLVLAQEASKALPDRPEVVRRLMEQGLKESTRDLGALRLEVVKALGRAYRETLQQPDAERDLLRRWLNDQRDQRLSATDAEGRLILADQYESLISDRESAIALLQAAWQIDPQSKEVADAFRRREFRKINDQWVEARRDRAASRLNADPTTEPISAPNLAALPHSTTLRGLSPDEVRARLGGKPDRIIWSATQGQLVEQWIYHGVNQDQYLSFLHSSGDPMPKVVASYARPRSRFESRPPR